MLNVASASERGEKQRWACNVVLILKYWHQAITLTHLKQVKKSTQNRLPHSVPERTHCRQGKQNWKKNNNTIKSIHRHNKEETQFIKFSFCPSFQFISPYLLHPFHFPSFLLFSPLNFLKSFFLSSPLQIIHFVLFCFVLIFLLLRPWEAVKVEQSESSKQPNRTTENKMSSISGYWLGALCSHRFLCSLLDVYADHGGGLCVIGCAALWVMQKS